MSDARRGLLERIEADRDRLVGFLQAFTRIDTANPPGDTRAGAAFIGDFLERAGLPYRRIAPQEAMPNLLAATGAIVDGRLHGLGTVDMKCGTTASIFTYAHLSGLADELRGRLTLTLVSDEETGGRWGSGYLVGHHGDEVLGDCVLNGEPSSPYTIRFGEKAMFWLKLSIRTPGGHSAYPHVSKSANRIAAALIRDLESLEALVPATPEKVARALGGPDVRAGAERGLGVGAAELLQRVTLNIGVMQGGVKVNMLPTACEIEADVRLPVGVDRDDVRRAIERIVARYPEATWEEGASQRANATWSDPEHAMVGHLQDNVQALRGFRPPAIISLGGTDCRFWRAAGTPAYVYGCSPAGMGAPNESVAIDEFLHVMRTHTLSAFDYLSRA